MNLDQSRLTMVALVVMVGLTLGLFSMLFIADVKPVEAAACYQYLYAFECRDECWPSLSCSNGTINSKCWYRTMNHYVNGDHYAGGGRAVDSCDHYVGWCWQSCY